MKKSVLHFLPTIRLSTCVFTLPYLLYLTLRVICLKAMRAAYLRGGTTQIIRCLSLPFAFYLCLSACICGCFSSVSYASPPLANDIHLREVLDYEDMWASDSLYAATKQALNLNVGEPRTVRMIYFLPNDRPFQQEVVDRMKVTIREIQTFYADQMAAHGHGRKTFRFETDAQGEPLVHRVDGKYPDSHYLDDTVGTVSNEIEQLFDVRQNIYIIAIDNSINGIGRGSGRIAGGTGGRRGKNGGLVLVPGRFNFFTTAHELGHTFGLRHDFQKNVYIMSYGGSRRNRLSACHAELLAVHPYFDPDIPDEEAPGPTVELISPNEYPTGSESVSVQLKVSDPDGLHQVILFNTTRQPHFAAGFLEVKACRGLTGETDAIVQFDYDGVIPSNENTSLSNPVVHKFQVEAVDTEGNVGEVSFSLHDISTSHNLIATLEGPTNSGYFAIPSVAFSPDGTIIVAGSRRGTIKLWDVVTQTSISTFKAGRSPMWEVAFSPDGTILAVVGGSLVKLWDVAKRTNILTLDTHTSHAYSVAFSPDNVSLAVGTLEGVQVWDVAASTPYLLFKRDVGRVGSVTFSPDGTILAVETSSMVTLWDVATWKSITTKMERGISSVAFSPDGTILGVGSRYQRVRLWDVAMWNTVATFTTVGDVSSVAFSPDGTILALGTNLNAIELWDASGEQSIATFVSHTDEIRDVTFSPDGKMLASGADDNTVKLWDTSAIIPRPQTLVKISGDKQAGVPGTPLGNPLVVEVRDQYGNVLEGVAVTFAVTEGDGMLSVKDATTNSRGRAQTRLTLGNTYGTTIVTATVAGIDESATFVIEAVATPDFDGDGTVGVSDFLLFVDQFGFSRSDGGYEARFDLDGDGVIGVSDFLIFVNDFGKKIS